MKQVFLLITILHALSMSSLAGEPTHIIAFGDSTTATRGQLNIYANRLGKELENITVTNAGVGGNSTLRAKQRFERDVLKKQPDIVIIQFGINDSAVDVWRKPPATKPRVAIKDYEANLRHFIKEIRNRDATPILMTPNPLRWTAALKKLYGKPPYEPDKPDGFNVLLRDYAAVVRKVAKAEQVELVDIYAAFEKAEPEKLLLDGMHPNDAGHALVTKQLLPVLRKVLGTEAVKP